MSKIEIQKCYLCFISCEKHFRLREKGEKNVAPFLTAIRSFDHEGSTEKIAKIYNVFNNIPSSACFLIIFLNAPVLSLKTCPFCLQIQMYNK